MFSITYFLLGILFITFYPTIQQFMSLLDLAIETAKGYLSVKINQYNQLISSAASQENENSSVRAIGFSYQYEDEQESTPDDN